MLARRFISYIIDIVFVSLLAGLLLQIRFLNPNYDNYYEINAKLMEIYEDAAKTKDFDILNSEEFTNLNYELKKGSLISSIIELIVFLGYFVGFQIWNKGQTLGKKLVRLKLVDKTDKEAKWYQALIRTMVLYNLYAGIISMVLINLLNKNIFIQIDGYLSYITSFIFYASALMILLRSDGRGIPDFLAGTKIIPEIVENK